MRRWSAKTSGRWREHRQECKSRPTQSFFRAPAGLPLPLGEFRRWGLNRAFPSGRALLAGLERCSMSSSRRIQHVLAGACCRLSKLQSSAGPVSRRCRGVRKFHGQTIRNRRSCTSRLISVSFSWRQHQQLVFELEFPPACGCHRSRPVRRLIPRPLHHAHSCCNGQNQTLSFAREIGVCSANNSDEALGWSLTGRGWPTRR